MTAFFLRSACLGFAGILLGGFLNFAPNRLARGFAIRDLASPPFEAAAAIAGLCGLALLSFAPGNKRRSITTILAVALILWGSSGGRGSSRGVTHASSTAGGAGLAWTRVLDLDQRCDPRDCRCHAKRKLRFSCPRLRWGGFLFGFRRDGGGRGVRSSRHLPGNFRMNAGSFLQPSSCAISDSSAPQLSLR